MKVAIFDLIVARQIDSVDCQIIELLMAYPTPSVHEIARKMKMPFETIRLKLVGLTRLLSIRCKEKTTFNYGRFDPISGWTRCPQA